MIRQLLSDRFTKSPLNLYLIKGALGQPRYIWISKQGQPFRFQFLLYLTLWTGLASATRLTRSGFMPHIGWIYFYRRGRGAWTYSYFIHKKVWHCWYTLLFKALSISYWSINQFMSSFHNVFLRKWIKTVFSSCGVKNENKIS